MKGQMILQNIYLFLSKYRSTTTPTPYEKKVAHFVLTYDSLK